VVRVFTTLTTIGRYAVGVVLASVAFGTGASLDLHAQNLDFSAIAEKLVERMQLQPGERVLLIAAPGEFDPLVDATQHAIEAAGGGYLGTIAVGGESPGVWRTDFTRRAAELNRQQLVNHFRGVDVGIMLPGATPADVPYLAMQDVLRSGQSRTIHFHWSGVYDLRSNPQQNSAIVDVLYERAVLDTDYTALAEVQRQFESVLRDNIVRVTTREGTDLSFHVGDRPVTRQDGNASAARAAEARNLIDREIELPAGAVRVAPLEESVRGTIVFPDATWNGVRVAGLTIHFANGRIVEMTAESGLEAVEAELSAAGPEARSFREFALGFNPRLPVQARGGDAWIPYYGYGAGVVRLSLGDNTELGGNVGGGYVRWNFFPNATVIVGSRVWVREGRMQ
jgi:hypothetical protein